ncbi:MAG: clostripain-related cysteine peptidase [Anaerolineae bacterium]
MKRLLLLVLLFVGSFTVVQAQSAPANWTIMHYTDVDNNLEGAAFNDYYEMQSVGSGNGVNIVTQLDRAEGFESRFGDWTDTRRFFIEQVPPQPEATIDQKRAAVVDFLVAQGAGDAETLTAQAAQTDDAIIQNIYENNNLGVTFVQTPVQELGEVDMGDPQSLVDFIEWSVTNYPAEHYMLVIGSHGGGWRGIGPDDGDGQKSMLELPEIGQALETARTDLGIDKFDIVGFDACLMAVADVAETLAPHVDYVLFSQEVIPSNGWEYFNSISAMQQNPDWDAFQVGSDFIDSYMDYYAGPGNRTKVGLSLVETAALPDLVTALDEFSAAIGADTVDLLSALGAARNNSQTFGTTLGDRADFYSYVDLRDFMTWFSLQTSVTEEAYNAAQAVIAAYDQAVVYSRADSKLPGGNGLAVYLPPGPTTYDAKYTEDAPASFAVWQNYLNEFYSAIVNNLDGSALQLAINNVFTLGDSGSTVDRPTVFFDAAGQGVVDLTYNIFYVAEDGTRTLVDSAPISYTTILPTGETVIEYPTELTPSTFSWGVEFPFVSDDTNSVLGVALSSGGSSSELTVSGTYVTAQGSQQAVLVFDAESRTYTGMLASDGTTVYQPVPNPGDQFIVDLVTLAPDGTVSTQPQADTPLTFGLEPFKLSYQPAVTGTYEVSLNMTDLAGNTVRQSTEVNVNNDSVDGSTRGYTDTNEGIYFQYPYAWGESYSFTNDDGSLTNAVSDETGAKAIYTDVYTDSDPQTTLENILAGMDGVVVDVTETTFGGLPAYMASYVTTDDSGTTGALVISLANEPAGTVVVLTFTSTGDNVEPDADVVNLVDQTLTLFQPVLN